MSDECCNDHDYIEPMGVECGLAGMGDALVCCKNCPELAWYKENQPTRKVVIWAELPEEDKALYE